MLLLNSFLIKRLITVLKKNSSSKIPVIVIFAPTASGKTALTKELFSASGSHFILNSEVVSADSMQVYKGMNIGTAKPDKEFCAQIPHHLIDLFEPDCQFNVSDFVSMADKECEDLFNKGKIPVVCGGTGFYIRNFLYGVPPTPESDETLRNQLKERISCEGNEALYAELLSIDPESAKKIHVNDSYRICRALEVYYLTGKKRSEYTNENNNSGLRDKYDFLFIVLVPPRDVLYERIKLRVDLMFQQGLKEEFISLLEKGFTKETPGMKAIGYSEFFNYFSEEDSIEEIKRKIDFHLDEIIYDIKHHSCKYAKKQYTYIRDIPDSIKVDFKAEKEDLTKIKELIQKFISTIDHKINL